MVFTKFLNFFSRFSLILIFFFQSCRLDFLVKCNRREIPTAPPCPFRSTTENPRPFCNDTSKIILLADHEDCQYFYICIWGERVHRKCLNSWYFSVSKLVSNLFTAKPEHSIPTPDIYFIVTCSSWLRVVFCYFDLFIGLYSHKHIFFLNHRSVSNFFYVLVDKTSRCIVWW